jgi:hypothetical protein
MAFVLLYDPVRIQVRKGPMMRNLIVIMLVTAGVVVYADAVLARGGGAGGAGGGTGAGAPAGATSGDGAAAGAGPSGPGAAGDDSAAETGPGDRLGGPAAGYANDPSLYRSPVTAWPGEIEFPSASPRSGVIVAPSATPVGVPATPLMCPGINAADPRKC